MTDAPQSHLEPVYQTTHDFSGPRSLQLTLVDALAVAENAPRTEVRPLYESVEPDSLESLFAHASTRESTLRVTFDAGSRRVAVDSDGQVEIYEADGESEDRDGREGDEARERGDSRDPHAEHPQA
ncbi:HalOD1 output domain-containing protein [Halorussus sp. AFM4]|uniref:HalOD1 output domain-containing protein n=1 Tax=Halorussus sp. AFM4 TaxID=3421651 RepID=UPI003EB9A7BE